MADRVVYEITQEESFFIGFELTDEGGQPIDLVNSTFSAHISEGIDSVDFFLTRTDIPGGMVQCQAASGRTLLWPPGSYDLDIAMFTGGTVDIPRQIIAKFTIVVEEAL